MSHDKLCCCEKFTIEGSRSSVSEVCELLALSGILLHSDDVCPAIDSSTAVVRHAFGNQ